jgi:PPM family protein phosphatase
MPVTNAFRIIGAMLSDVGCVRAKNEDSVAFVIHSRQHAGTRELGYALVADGMGGHAAGEVASALAAEVVRQSYSSIPGPVAPALEQAFQDANRAILELAEQTPEYAGMGTTCSMIVFEGEGFVTAHVGDSRIYRLRDGALTQITRDQTYFEQLRDSGVMSVEEARASPQAHMLVQAMGTRPALKPEIIRDAGGLLVGDTIILCSDGLTNCLSDDDIGRLPLDCFPYETCDALIAQAREKGAPDNVSVGVFRVIDDGVDFSKPR